MDGTGQATGTTDRLGLYRTIHQTTLEQRRALEGDDFTSFHELMVRREELIATAEGVASNAGELADPRERAQASGLIREILELDEANQRLLSEKLEAARKELNTLRSGRQLVRRYGASAPAESRFVDRQG